MAWCGDGDGNGDGGDGGDGDGTGNDWDIDIQISGVLLLFGLLERQDSFSMCDRNSRGIRKVVFVRQNNQVNHYGLGATIQHCPNRTYAEQKL